MDRRSTDVSERTLVFGTRWIHFTTTGQGPAVLLLHGGGPGASGRSNYARNVDALARHFKVIVPDLPGYGRSTKDLDSDNPFADLAAAMFDVLDALDIECAHLVGNSLGGACALTMALDRPERIGRVVLMGPGGVGISQATPTDGLKRLLGYYQGEGPTLEKLRQFVCEDLVFDSTQVTDALLRERFEASIDPDSVANPPLRMPRDLQAFRRLDFLLDSRLAALDNPTLVVWGTEDRVNPPGGAMELQRRMRACDLHLFSRTGHWVQWERAAEFNALVTSFLRA